MRASNPLMMLAGQSLHDGDGVIEVTPADAHCGAGVCTGIVLDLEHRSALAIATAGEWTIRVRGRRVRADGSAWEEPVAAETTGVVR